MWDLSLQHMGSLVEACGLSFSNACGILVPWPGIKPTSPASEGGFLTTGPPGKSLQLFLESLSLSPSIVHFPVFCLPAFWVLIPGHPKFSLRRWGHQATLPLPLFLGDIHPGASFNTFIKLCYMGLKIILRYFTLWKTCKNSTKNGMCLSSRHLIQASPIAPVMPGVEGDPT